LLVFLTHVSSVYGGIIANFQGRSFQSRDRVKAPRINSEITASPVRLIGSDGKQAGVVDIVKALGIARDAGLDLVEIAPAAKPPVCKVIDYGKYRYEQTKKQKDARKKQHNVQVKRVQLKPNIDTHDFNVKLSAGRRFIEAGHRVKVLITMRGRMVTRKDIADEVLTRMVESLSDIAVPDGSARMEGANNLSVVLVKKKGK